MDKSNKELGLSITEWHIGENVKAWESEKHVDVRGTPSRLWNHCVIDSKFPVADVICALVTAKQDRLVRDFMFVFLEKRADILTGVLDEIEERQLIEEFQEIMLKEMKSDFSLRD